MKHILTLIIFFLGIGTQVYSQHLSNLETRGNKYFFVYSFDKAITAYSKVNKLTINGQRNLAQSYCKLNQSVEAEEVYSNQIMASEEKTSLDYFDYAMVLKSNGKYKEANMYMEKFADANPNDLRTLDFKAHKDDFDMLFKNDSTYLITTINTNSNAEDFGCVYYKDKIVFTSSRGVKPLLERRYNWNNKPFLDLYVADVKERQLGTASFFNKNIKGKQHNGTAGFSKDGTFMAFTRNSSSTRRKNKVVNLEIYFSSNKNEKWSTPESYALNNPEYSVGQPCLTADGNTMYFVSDKAGGFGGTDIYRATKSNDGIWSTPENLGNSINTEGDEMFPFIEENNKAFFFASNGRCGLGGLDIFMGNITDSGFQEVHNLGSPLNTKYDDFGVIVDKDMKRGYFSSNRASGKGGDDIYAFDMVKKEILPVKPETLIVEELPTIVAVSKYEEPVIVPSPKNEMPDLAALNKTVANLSIYFDLDKSNIRPDAQIGLEKIVKILNDYPTMILELKSFTDCRATERYNQNLSERRANESLRYLKDRITHPERISGKGLGEKNLANDCDCEDKAVSQCAEPQHQKNRRTEFVIISK